MSVNGDELGCVGAEPGAVSSQMDNCPSPGHPEEEAGSPLGGGVFSCGRSAPTSPECAPSWRPAACGAVPPPELSACALSHGSLGSRPGGEPLSRGAPLLMLVTGLRLSSPETPYARFTDEQPWRPRRLPVSASASALEMGPGVLSEGRGHGREQRRPQGRVRTREAGGSGGSPRGGPGRARCHPCLLRAQHSGT